MFFCIKQSRSLQVLKKSKKTIMKNLIGLQYFCLVIVLGLFSCSQNQYEIAEEIANQLPATIDYNFHVKPILSDRCYSCHGPDEKTRKANFRLDLEEDALAKLTSGTNEHAYAIYKKKPGKSELIKRLYTDDEDLMMPPPESKLLVTEYEKAILQKWIEQGAEWKPHWSFTPPKKSSLPEVKNKAWVQNDIDHFVLNRIEKEGLENAPRADQERLLRRVYLDLTGLPPTVEAMDHFLNDQNENAFEKVVDQLLATDAYAERLTLDWLDVARYADSHGLHADGWRDMSAWRDWVIQAFKENKTYDQFIIEQVAGDLLPDKNREKILATAFNRNHPITSEGGVVGEEYRLEYVFDRTSTVATAFMGITMACARCHDHKFDPISQKEFFQMSAFFNNIQELGMTGDDGNFGPLLLLPDDSTQLKLDELAQSVSEKKTLLATEVSNLEASKEFILSLKNESSKLPKPDFYFPLEKITRGTVRGKKDTQMADLNNKTSIVGEVEIVDGKVGKAFQFDDGYKTMYLHGAGNFDVHRGFTISTWMNTDKSSLNESQTLFGTAGEKDNFWRGWDFFIDSTGHLSARLISTLPNNLIQATSSEKIKINEWTHVALSYDGSGKAAGLQIYLNGIPCQMNTNFDNLYKNIRTLSSKKKENYRSVRVAKSNRMFTGEYGIFSGMIDDIKIFHRRISHLEILQLIKPDEIAAELASNPENMDQEILLDHLNWTASPQTKSLRKELANVIAEKIKITDPVEEIMVMQEMKEARSMYILDRGSYEFPTEEVGPNTPKAIFDFPDDFEKNRLGFAKWLVDKRNPLTARVTVNRYWQMIFGKGLVETPQDFGIQGSLPSHPDLLDYLAVDFMESGWDVKALLKKIVTSATYQQSSKSSIETKEIDPYNKLLARGPSYRLQAEMIRDNALAASGLLKRKVGGGSVRPYQPDGLWVEKANFSKRLLRYKTTSGDSLYRRSMYTFIRRTSPHPAMLAFDAPDRSVCTVKRENTNTPLQALVLLNDPQFMEAAKALAVRVQEERTDDLQAQLALAFRLLTARKASSEELQVFSEFYHWQFEKFNTNPSAVKQLLDIGQFQVPQENELVKTAALTSAISTIISHDESYTKR